MGATIKTWVMAKLGALTYRMMRLAQRPNSSTRPATSGQSRALVTMEKAMSNNNDHLMGPENLLRPRRMS